MSQQRVIAVVLTKGVAWGNAFAPGNPHAKRVARLRSALLDAVTPADVEAIAFKLVELVKSGEIIAIRELFLRTHARPIEGVVLDRLERPEALLLAEQAITQ